MRTALCLSGQPRNIKMGFPYINKFLIQPFKSDVFVHTWVNPEDVGKKIYHPVNNNVLSDPIEENVGDIILDLYHPICWKFEKQIQFDPKDFKQLSEMVSTKIRDYCPGVKWKDSYATLGRFDVVDIVEADNLKQVEKAAMFIRAYGHSETETLVATPWKEFLARL